MPTLAIHQERGGHLETIHPVSAVLAGPDGVIEVVGDDRATTWRSAAKPFQLETSFGLLPAPWRDVDDADLAVGAASHSGEAGHVARVQRLLAKFGLGEADLYCGGHAPADAVAADDLVREGRAFTAVHNNCSGKHTFMAAAARAHGWEADYRPVDHPLQARIRERVVARSGVEPSAVVDGCGVPCWVLPLSGMARAWAALGVAGDDLGRIGRAMREHPWETSGTGRPEVLLMQTAARPLVCKVGAEGLMCGAMPARGLGFAIKVHTGNAEARAVATWALLGRWDPGLVPPDGADAWRIVRNVIGREVGARRAVETSAR